MALSAVTLVAAAGADVEDAVRITPTGTITDDGLFGRSIHTSTASLPEILPGQTVTLTDTVAGIPLLDRVTARVELEADGVTADAVALWRLPHARRARPGGGAA